MRSKEALDKIIRKSRVHLYKPIQIAEILHRHRIRGDIELNDLESYRNRSKAWRDEVSRLLVGRICTSSQKFQDNLFEKNAMPPNFIKELGEFNKRNGGIIEAYIYKKLEERLTMVSSALDYLKKTKPESFELKNFLNIFRKEPGLKRSIDKAYEIVVYALFTTITRALNVEVSLTIRNIEKEIVSDFERFLKIVLGLSKSKPKIVMPANFYRVGVANAADRGLDMWSNFGPAIQVKHISFNEKMALDVVEGITADKIVIVCRDAEKRDIERAINAMKSLGIEGKVQGIVTVSDLEEWYSLCLKGKYKSTLGRTLVKDIIREFGFEFPSTREIPHFIRERGYDRITLKGDWE